MDESKCRKDSSIIKENHIFLNGSWCTDLPKYSVTRSIRLHVYLNILETFYQRSISTYKATITFKSNKFIINAF